MILCITIKRYSNFTIDKISNICKNKYKKNVLLIKIKKLIIYI